MLWVLDQTLNAQAFLHSMEQDAADQPTGSSSSTGSSGSGGSGSGPTRTCRCGWELMQVSWQGCACCPFVSAVPAACYVHMASGLGPSPEAMGALDPVVPCRELEAMCAAHWPAVQALAAACDLGSCAGALGCSWLAVSLAVCMAKGPLSLATDADLYCMFRSMLGHISKVSQGILHNLAHSQSAWPALPGGICLASLQTRQPLLRTALIEPRGRMATFGRNTAGCSHAAGACSQLCPPHACNMNILQSKPAHASDVLCSVQMPDDVMTFYGGVFLAAERAPRLAALLVAGGHLEAMTGEVERLDARLSTTRVSAISACPR